MEDTSEFSLLIWTLTGSGRCVYCHCKSLHPHRSVLRFRSRPCRRVGRPPSGKTRLRWLAVCCTSRTKNSAGDKQSPALYAPPEKAGCPADTMHTSSQNACGDTHKHNRYLSVHLGKKWAWNHNAVPQRFLYAMLYLLLVVKLTPIYSLVLLIAL